MDKSKIWKTVKDCNNETKLKKFIKNYRAGVEGRQGGYNEHSRDKDDYFKAIINGITTIVETSKEKRDWSFNEPRLAYAFANSQIEHETLGSFIDLQIPLKSKNNQHVGKVDLISKKVDILFLIELKKHNSSEPLLRPIIEVFLYCSIIIKNEKIKKKFLGSFGAESCKICPAILVPDNTFKKRITRLNQKCKSLINLLNSWLETNQVNNLRFFKFSEKATSKIMLEPTNSGIKITFPQTERKNLGIEEFKIE